MMWEPFLSLEDLSFLNKDDIVKITFSPISQKHFDDPNYNYYFPSYEGKVLTSNPKTLNDLYIETADKTIINCINRAGSSAFVSAYYLVAARPMRLSDST